MHRVLVASIFLATIPAAAFAAPWPLEVERVEVDIVVDGRLASTKVSHVIRNRSSTSREGVYQIALPEGAATTRLAMTVQDRMMEGELVDRGRARGIYEGIVRSKKDPALLEWQAPGLYQLRIFPIEPMETKDVVIEYEEIGPHCCWPRRQPHARQILGRTMRSSDDPRTCEER